MLDLRPSPGKGAEEVIVDREAMRAAAREAADRLEPPTPEEIAAIRRLIRPAVIEVLARRRAA